MESRAYRCSIENDATPLERQQYQPSLLGGVPLVVYKESNRSVGPR